MDWIWVLVAVAGILILAFTWYLTHLQRKRLLTTGIRATAVVVRHQLRLSRVATVTECVVRFTTAQGKVVEAASPNGIATIVPDYAIGTKVEVAYDKADPTDFVVLGLMERSC